MPLCVNENGKITGSRDDERDGAPRFSRVFIDTGPSIIRFEIRHPVEVLTEKPTLHLKHGSHIGQEMSY